MVALGFAKSADKAIERFGQECDKLSGTQRAMSIGGEDFIGSILGFWSFGRGHRAWVAVSLTSPIPRHRLARQRPSPRQPACQTNKR